jgi:hypothetical protein
MDYDTKWWEERYEAAMEKRARQRGYEVIGELKPEDVLPFTGPDAEPKEYFGHPVKMTSLRYQTFLKSLMCKCCGLYGTVMLLEMPSNGGKICIPHFNLYAKREGVLVQMTKDHIQPKSRGGKDNINNMQTLCSRCNELKGSHVSKLKRLREIQDGVQTVYTVEGLEGFATSDRGIAEIVRKYVVGTYKWDEGSFEVRVSTRLKNIQVLSGVGEPVTFVIKPIRRV